MFYDCNIFIFEFYNIHIHAKLKIQEPKFFISGKFCRIFLKAITDQSCNQGLIKFCHYQTILD